MARSTPHPIDVYVGSRVRLKRILVGMSQEKLGDALGLTFQQIQKYEKGSNRISASKLYLIAGLLGVPVQFFYDDMPDDALSASKKKPKRDPGPQVIDFVNSSEGIKLNSAFTSIDDPDIRKCIIGLAKSLSEI